MEKLSELVADMVGKAICPIYSKVVRGGGR